MHFKQLNTQTLYMDVTDEISTSHLELYCFIHSVQRNIYDFCNLDVILCTVMFLVPVAGYFLLDSEGSTGCIC